MDGVGGLRSCFRVCVLKQPVIPLLCLLLVPVSVQAGGLYRWVNSQGEVQYSDIVPPAVAQQGHSELNDQGMTVKTVPAPPTPEELAARKRQETLAKLRDQQVREKQIQDAYLLANYTSLDELDAVYKSKQALLADNTLSIKERSSSLKERMDTVRKQLDKAGEEKLRKQLEDYIKDGEVSLTAYQHAVEENETEKESLRQRYEQEKKRLAELLSASPSSPLPDLSKAPAKQHEEPARQ